jgi:hypothetical protein
MAGSAMDALAATRGSGGMPDLVTVPEAAVILGLSYQGADYLIVAHEVKLIKRIGNARLYRRKDIEALAATERKPGRPRKEAKT